MPGAADYPIIDADSHLTEDYERLAELTDARYRAFAPRMVAQGPSEILYMAGTFMPQPPGMTWGDTTTRGGLRAGKRRMAKWNEAEIAGFDPAERLKLMDAHGTYGSVIFPSIGLFAGAIPDPKIAAAVCRGVNRYVAEFCSADSSRLWPTATVPLADADLAAAEARYAVEDLGAVAVFTPSGVHGPQPIYHPYYERFFDTMAELGVPYCTHTGAAVIGGRGLGAERFPGLFPPFHMTTHVCEAMIASVGLITHGVLDRLPELKIGFFEAGAGWMPFWLDRMHENWEAMGWMTPELKSDPYETFLERCLVTVEGDEAMLAPTVAYLGGKAIAWSSDIPHFDCEDGRPGPVLDNENIPADHMRCLLRDNAVAFFGLDVAG